MTTDNIVRRHAARRTDFDLTAQPEPRAATELVANDGAGPATRDPVG